MSAEILSPEKKTESPESVAEALRDNFESTKLEPGKIHEIVSPNPYHKNEMSSCGNESLQVYQYLRAVVKAGSEIFYILDSTTMIESEDSDRPEFIEKTVITRRNPDGGRADFVSFLEAGSQPIEIGRDHQSGLDGTLSRNHFAIAKAPDGAMGIVDNNSTNGTELFSAKESPIEEKYGFEKQESNMRKLNPVKQYRSWSVSSAQLKSRVASTYTE